MADRRDPEQEHEAVTLLVAAARTIRTLEPLPGKVEASDLSNARGALDKLAACHAKRGGLDGLSRDDVERVEGRMAALYAHAAAIAIALRETGQADRWLTDAEKLARDDGQRAELAAGRRSPERFRALIHGRMLIANDRERAARAVWRKLTRDQAQGEARAPRGIDPIAQAAREELEAPRALGPNDSTPTLARINGIGAGFYGRSKVWPDGSYATMHCVSVVWIPVYPLSGWRVRDADGGYHILAREPLPGWARRARWVIPLAIAAVIAAAMIQAYLTDPDRLARKRWDAVIALADGGDAETALRQLDEEVSQDGSRVDAERAERAGAAIVRLAVGRVATPFTAGALDQAIRVVRRYQALPDRVRAGAAQAAMHAAIQRWVEALGTTADTAEPRLALLRAAVEVAPRADFVEQLIAARIALAATRRDEWPLDALALLVEGRGAQDRAAIAAADPIVARLAESPSMLLDAGDDLEAWLAATTDAAAKSRVAAQRKAASEGRSAAEADGVSPAELAAMATQRPWDQYVQLQLARGDASAGKLDAAAARLGKLGAPGMTIRDARFLLAQLTAAEGKLEAADAMLTSLLAGRLPRFAAASAAMAAAFKSAQDRIKLRLDTGDLPSDLVTRANAASETARHDIVMTWIDEQMRADSALSAARASYLALGDVVPAALASGSIKLRRAQAMSGAARDAMLQDAERALLAIRGEAEGRPEFRLALGETYARLGKSTESEAEFAAVLKDGSPPDRLRVAKVYRALGNLMRAMQVLEQVFAAASGEAREAAAELRGRMALEQGREDEAETWLRKAGTRADARTSLLEIEAMRLGRNGKSAECAAKFAEIAKLHLAAAGTLPGAGHNNAAVAYESGFDCSGDPEALRSAERALETAYRNEPDDSIVVSNLADVLGTNAQLRVLQRHIDTRALRLQLRDVARIMDVLLVGPARDAELAALRADRGMRRSSELLAQAEVLAPSNIRLLSSRFASAERLDDLATATALVDRVRRAKGLDVEERKAARERARSGADDAKRLAGIETRLARIDAIMAHPPAGMSAKTRAAGWLVIAEAASDLGLYKLDPAQLARAREAATTAMQLWPALDCHALLVEVVLDEAGVASDGKAWLAERRLRNAVSALDYLAGKRAALADQIRGAKSWAAVVEHAHADGTRPTMVALHLARLLGDAALETRARAVRDDRMAHLSLEIGALFDPADEVARSDLALLDAR
jgi:hypothetical protein